MGSCSFINNSLLHGSAWCSVAHPRSPGPEPAYLRVPRSRLAAASMFLGGTPKMLKSLNSIGRGYLRLLGQSLAHRRSNTIVALNEAMGLDATNHKEYSRTDPHTFYMEIEA